MGSAALAFIDEQLDRLPVNRLPVANPKDNEWWRYTDKHATTAWPSVCWNANSYTNVIGVDLDVGWRHPGVSANTPYSEAVTRCLDAFLKPNVIMIGENGRLHAAYWMRTPRFVGEGAPDGTRRFVQDMTKRVRHQLGGDTSYSNVWIKNPHAVDIEGKPLWQTRLLMDRPYTWDELAELPRVAELIIANPNEAEEIAASKGRNSHLFYLASHTAYQNWSHRYDADWSNRVLDYVQEWNDLRYADRPLGQNELERIAKSIAKWVTHRYTPKVSARPFRPFRHQRKNFVLTFTADQGQHQRQHLGALYVADLKRTRTEKAIREARILSGYRVTQKELAALTGFSLRTVKSYWATTGAR